MRGQNKQLNRKKYLSSVDSLPSPSFLFWSEGQFFAIQFANVRNIPEMSKRAFINDVTLKGYGVSTRMTTCDKGYIDRVW